MDVVQRYDVDGVQFDDYFYPDPEKDAAGRELNFPDDASWRKYGVSSGLSRDDWRRANVNQFIQSVYHSIKAMKPWVKFGVSPFGIWRPGFPKQIQGMDAYAKIYADSRLWLANGWLDYLAPQLYWPIGQQGAKFSRAAAMVVGTKRQKAAISGRALHDFRRRRIVPDEIPRQIQIAREQSGAAAKFIFTCAVSPKIPHWPTPFALNTRNPHSCPRRRGWIPFRRTSRNSPSVKAAPAGVFNGKLPAANRHGCGSCNSARMKFGRRKFCRQTKRRGPFSIPSRMLFRSAQWTEPEI